MEKKSGRAWVNKSPDAGKDWRQEEKGTTEDEMAGWHHWLNGHEPEWTPIVGDGQGGLACCSPWGHRASDTTEQPNCTEPNDFPLAELSEESFFFLLDSAVGMGCESSPFWFPILFKVSI